MALKNLGNRSVLLEEESKESQADWRATEEEFYKVQRERDELYAKFQKGVEDVCVTSFQIPVCTENF